MRRSAACTTRRHCQHRGTDLPAAPASSFEGVAASFSEAGTLRWQVPLTGTSQLFPRSASTSSNGLTAVTGSFTGTLDVAGQTRTSLGGNDIFYVALDDKGGVAALQVFGGTGEDWLSRDLRSARHRDPGRHVQRKVSFGGFPLDAGTGRTDMFVVRMSPGARRSGRSRRGSADVGAAWRQRPRPVTSCWRRRTRLPDDRGDAVTAVGSATSRWCGVSGASDVDRSSGRRRHMPGPSHRPGGEIGLDREFARPGHCSAARIHRGRGLTASSPSTPRR